VNGTNHGFEGWSTFKSQSMRLHSLPRTQTRVASQPVTIADPIPLRAGLGRLRQLYAARIAAAMLCKQGDVSAMIAALQSERDAALDQLRETFAVGQSPVTRRCRPKARYRVRAFEPNRPGRKRHGARRLRPSPT